MTHATRNGFATFQEFFEGWIVEQNHHLEELVTMSKEHEEHQRQQGRNGWTQTLDETILRALVERVIQHYELYYRAKSRWARDHITSMFKPTWLSNLDDSFLWIGGWCPTMAVHLLYSKSGIQMEARQDEIIRALQETVADASMVELMHSVSEMIREGAADETMEDGRVDATLAPKEEGTVRNLQMADDLRLKTLKKVVEILSPIQSVYFLLAAAELHVRVQGTLTTMLVRMVVVMASSSDKATEKKELQSCWDYVV